NFYSLCLSLFESELLSSFLLESSLDDSFSLDDVVEASPLTASADNVTSTLSFLSTFCPLLTDCLETKPLPFVVTFFCVNVSKAITSSFVQPVMSGIVISPSVSNNTLLFGSTSLSGDTDCLTTLSPLPMTIGSRDLPFTLSCAFCVS